MIVHVFLNCDTGDMRVFSSLEEFKRQFSDCDLSQRNDRGDVIVNLPGTNRSFGRNLGYIQVREVQ